MNEKQRKERMTALGAVFDHVGVATDDLDKTIDFLSSFPDIGEWKKSVHAHEQKNLIVGTPYALAVGKACVASGDYFYEVVQPIREACTPGGYFYQWDPEKNGLHHLAYAFDTEEHYREALAMFLAEGDKEVLHGLVPPKEKNGWAIEYVYLEPVNGCGVNLELVCRKTKWNNN